ncbi:hypothetical protein NC653_030698 [Populus alba x Populus x berolinensis]|uniref:TRUD domain-containing protein n=1 Tax=Populus alba x Populus x berolinensis TaxID=444605 RepID=A0AAD6LXS8_9ROSI|nr:hypothetical protein NC653_030698 [Populus alba x Populus x berolinensis]
MVSSTILVYRLYTFQRFGSGSVSTHFLGAALLRGEWESAVSKILDPRDVMRKAREYYEESNDIEGTLRQLLSPSGG